MQKIKEVHEANNDMNNIIQSIHTYIYINVYM